MSGLGMNPFKDYDVEYVWQPYWTFINPENGTIDYSYFEKNKNRLFIINFSSEHWNNFEHWVCKWLEEAGINFLILTYDHTRHQEHPCIFYFPYWYYWGIHPTQGWQKWANVNIGLDKTYFLGSLNGQPRSHRIANFLKLRKKSFWNNSSISFHNDVTVDRPEDLPLTDDEMREWLTIQSTLPACCIPKTIGELSLNTPQLNDSYLHLVTETTVLPKVFISEKTWKPIGAAVPFVMLGNPGTVSFLKSQGVDTYDDVIDHKYYDSEENARLRLDKLHEVIDNLVDQGLDKIHNQLFDRALENQRKFFNGEFDQTYMTLILNAINQYK